MAATAITTPAANTSTPSATALKLDARLIEVDKIRPSATNPRKHFDVAALAELAADITARGVIEPILVCTQPKGLFQIIVGERRWRASQHAGMLTIPAIVRDDMSPALAAETQLVENLQRSDLNPVEEAESLRRLQQEYGYTIPDLMARVHKESNYVYGRLALLVLPESAKKALAEGAITAGVAVLIARLPHANMRADAAKAILRTGHPHGPMGHREASIYVQAHFHLALKGAPFNPADADLLPAAGPCSTCPKRTGSNPSLFADVSPKDDSCTDARCYGDKREIAWKQSIQTAKAKGLAVLSDQEADKVLSHGQVRYGANFVDLDTHCDLDPKDRTWRKLLGKDVPQVKLARDTSTFQVRQLVVKDEAFKVLAQVAPEVVKHQRPRAATVTPAQKKERAKEREKVARAKLVAQAARREVARCAAGEKAMSVAVWKFLGTLLIGEMWTESAKEVAEAHDYAIRGTSYSDIRQALKTGLAKLTNAGEVRSLVFEILLTQQSRQRGGSFDDVLRDACKAFGIDTRKVAAEALRKVSKDAEEAKPRRK